MLAEELILHFAPAVFKGYKIKSKSLLRITRNADIDADALYDEDLDYREFMEGLIKQRKKLAPIRLELSREMDGDVVEISTKKELPYYVNIWSWMKAMYSYLQHHWICRLYSRSRIFSESIRNYIFQNVHRSALTSSRMEKVS